MNKETIFQQLNSWVDNILIQAAADLSVTSIAHLDFPVQESGGEGKERGMYRR